MKYGLRKSLSSSPLLVSDSKTVAASRDHSRHRSQYYTNIEEHKLESPQLDTVLSQIFSTATHMTCGKGLALDDIGVDDCQTRIDNCLDSSACNLRHQAWWAPGYSM